MKRLESKVCIVTGGSRGIGEAIVRRIAADGAIVYATYNSGKDRADALQSELSSQGYDVTFVQTNVADEESVKSLLETVLGRSQRLDAVVNNAGVTKDNLLMRMSEADWDFVMDTNLKSVFFMTKHCMRPMMSQRSGRIVNISSVVGITGNAGQANYVASKAGLIGMSKSLAKELASRNILVNCIAPGYIATDMTAKLSDAQRAAFADLVPLKRAGSGDEIAGAVSFLLSDDASYITGQTLVIDGGMTM